MLTLASIALAALLWLLRLTLGDDPAAYGPLQSQWIEHAALGLSVLAAVLFVRRMLSHALPGWSGNERRATSELLQAVMSIVLYAVATMLYLSLGLHLDITSVLATSAVLSVIVGLALQPTLGNLFAGVSIEIERPVREGDFVRRDTMEGRVVSLSWRSVCLQTDRGSRIVLPNHEFNSRPVEVIPAGQPYRQQVEFVLAGDVPPTSVMQVALQVLCSDLPGICADPAPSVVVLGADTATGTLRYAARFHTLLFLDRTSISSRFLERFWYALSREGLHGHAWRPPLDVNIHAMPGNRADVAQLPGAGQAAAAEAWSGNLLRQAPADSRLEAALSHLHPALGQALRDSPHMLRYGPLERWDREAVALVLEGSLYEARPMEATEREGAFRTLMQAMETSGDIHGPLHLDRATHQELLHEGTVALGPLAYALCQRIATLTADPHLAYRAFAQSIPHAAQREQFLAKAPPQTHRLLREGDWLGWAHVLGLEVPPRECRAASQGCTLLTWPGSTIRQTLALLPDPQQEALAQRLRNGMPGCAELAPEQLRARIRHD